MITGKMASGDDTFQSFRDEEDDDEEEEEEEARVALMATDDH